MGDPQEKSLNIYHQPKMRLRAEHPGSREVSSEPRARCSGAPSQSTPHLQALWGIVEANHPPGAIQGQGTERGAQALHWGAPGLIPRTACFLRHHHGPHPKHCRLTKGGEAGPNFPCESRTGGSCEWKGQETCGTCKTTWQPKSASPSGAPGPRRQEKRGRKPCLVTGPRGHFPLSSAPAPLPGYGRGPCGGELREVWGTFFFIPLFWFLGHIKDCLGVTPESTQGTS